MIEKFYEWIKRRPMAVKEWISRIKDSLWFRPVLWLIGMALLAFGFVAVDWFFISAEAWDDMSFLFQSHVEGARTMLGAVIGATLTVASLAFSLMMVVVIQAANAYTPRLLHRFVADTHNHHVMGVLLGGFIYSIIVLRSLRDEPTVFIPQLALNVSVLISVFALIALISFIHHVASSIEVGNIISLIEEQTTKLITGTSYRRVGQCLAPFTPTGEHRVVYSNGSGYVRVLDVKLLEDMTKDSDMVIQMHCSVGDHLIVGSRLLTVWGEKSHDDKWCERAHDIFVTGNERSWVQDEAYGLQQLTDISLRALSPGINDPTTGIMGLDSLTQLLGAILIRGPRSAYRELEEGGRLIFLKSDMEDACVNYLWPIFDYGQEDCAVVRALVYNLGELGLLAHDASQRDILWRMLCDMHARIDSNQWSGQQIEVLDDLFAQAHDKFGHGEAFAPLGAQERHTASAL